MPFPTTTSETYQHPVYPEVKQGTRLIPTYSDGWMSNTLPSIRPVTPNKGYPMPGTLRKDPKMGLGKGVSVSNTLYTWSRPAMPAPTGFHRIGQDNLVPPSMLSTVKLGPAAPGPSVQSTMHYKTLKALKTAQPVEYGFLADSAFSGTPSSTNYQPAPAERKVDALVNFSMTQPLHTSGFRTNFKTDRLEAGMRNRWPADGTSISASTFNGSTKWDRGYFPKAPYSQGPGAHRSGFTEKMASHNHAN